MAHKSKSCALDTGAIELTINTHVNTPHSFPKNQLTEGLHAQQRSTPGQNQRLPITQL